MGFFTKDKRAEQKVSAPAGTASLGSGRRLRSQLPPDECARVLDQVFGGYRERKYPALPLLVPTGIRWQQADSAPSMAFSGNDQSDDFLLVTLTPAGSGTEAGLFPLGSGDDRLTLAAVGHWKMRDNSLSSTGIWPGGTVRLAPPPVTDQLIDDTLAAAGYPCTPGNRTRIGEMLFQMVLVKCWEFINSQAGQAVAARFTETQKRDADWSSLTGPVRAALQGLAEWNAGVLPYIQDLPLRFHAMMLTMAPENAGVWSELER